MLIHPSLEKLRALKLPGMALALEVQMGNPEYQRLSFEERLGLLVDNEITERENRRLKSRLKTANLKHSACMQNIDYRSSRKLDKPLLCSLEACLWISSHKNIIITGATGTGKSFMAEALAHNACVKGYRARTIRMPKLFNEIEVAKADGSYLNVMKSLSKYDVITLDDFGISPLKDEQRRDLLEIIEDRHNQTSTIITSQLPVKLWHQAIGDSTLADAILDRLVHNAYRIELEGESMRKILSNNKEANNEKGIKK
jgi:DNA replication protein DnaC